MELAGELFRVLLMRLEQGQAALQQRLQLWILCIRDERTTERSVDGLVIRHLVIDIGLVKRGSLKGGKLIDAWHRLAWSRFGSSHCPPA